MHESHILARSNFSQPCRIRFVFFNVRYVFFLLSQQIAAGDKFGIFLLSRLCKVSACPHKASLLHSAINTGWAKNGPLYFCPYLSQLLTDFQNSSTGTLCRQFAIM